MSTSTLSGDSGFNVAISLRYSWRKCVKWRHRNFNWQKVSRWSLGDRCMSFLSKISRIWQICPSFGWLRAKKFSASARLRLPNRAIPHQRLCPWTLQGAPPLDRHHRLALGARHVLSRPTFHLFPTLMALLLLRCGLSSKFFDHLFNSVLFRYFCFRPRATD